MTGPARVHLRIGRLVVDGLSGISREGLAEAVRSELARRLEHATDAAAWQPGHRERADGGAFRLQPGADSAAVGRQIAAAVERGLGAP